MPCHVKICGLSEEMTLRAAVNAGAELIGFVHFPTSPRHVTLDRANQLKKLLPPNVASVLVLVDPDDALLAEITTAFNFPPTYLQLHGSETPERVAEIRKKYPKQKLIKAIPVAAPADLAAAKAYEPYVDMLLFDAKPPKNTKLPGGNGLAFNWGILKGFASKRPWLLSGGLNPQNVRTAINQSTASYVDVSSGVEGKQGIKDAGKINAFIQTATA